MGAWILALGIKEKLSQIFLAEGVTERLKSMLYKVYGSNAFKVK